MKEKKSGSRYSWEWTKDRKEDQHQLLLRMYKGYKGGAIHSSCYKCIKDRKEEQ